MTGRRRTRQRKAALLALGVLFALLLAVTLLTRESPPEERSVRPLFSIDAISQLRLEAPAAPTIELQRDAERWLLVEPVQARADRAAVTALLEVLRSAVGRPFGSADEDELARFGLQRDAGLLVTVRDEAGREEQLLLGNVVPLDVGYVYALEPGSGLVYRVYREIRTLLEQHPDALRDRTLVEFDPAGVERLTIEPASQYAAGTAMRRTAEPVELVRSGHWWELVRPVELPADDAAVVGLLQEIAALRIAAFLDTGDSAQPLPDAAADPVLFRLNATLEDGSVHRLDLGPALEDGRYRLVRSGKTDSWVVVPAHATEGWPPAREQLVNRAPLRFRVEDIVRASVTRAGGSLELTLSEDQWQIIERPTVEAATAEARDTDAQARPAATAAVRHALTRIAALRVDDVTTAELPPAALALTPGAGLVAEPRVTVALLESDGTEHQLELIEEPDTGLYYGRSSFRPMPFVTDAQALSGLPLSADALADRRLLAFDSNRVAAVEIQTAEATIRLERRDGQWQVEAPRRARADQPRAWGVVFALESALFRRRVTDSGGVDQLRREGSGAVTVTLRDSGRTVLGTIVLAEGDASAHGDAAIVDGGEYVLAATSARPGIVTVDAELLQRIPTRVEDLEFRR